MFLFGALAALAFAPTNLLITAIIGFTVLFLHLDQEKSSKKLFWLGWSFAFGHFVVGFYWIAISLLVDIVKFGWLIPFAVSLIPAAMAIYVGLAALLSQKISRYFKLAKLERILIFAIFWVGFEYLRASLFSGFPWNLMGYVFVPTNNIAQLASIIGIYGLSLLALLTCILPALLCEIKNGKIELILLKQNNRNFAIIGIWILILASIAIWGNHRSNSVPLTSAKNGNIRIVQPNIEQTYKWDPKYKYQSFIKNVELSLKDAKSKNINYVIWSESSIPYLLDSQALELLDAIKKAVPPNGFVISGALRAEFKEDGEVDRVFNSVAVINDQGKITDIYDKRHLVPFGEYVPLQKYLPFISKITDGAEGFASGVESKTIKPVSDLPGFHPLICYEVIFSGLINDVKERPDFLLNVTNDAWFGRSSGPYQHLAMAQIRSIEYGLPLIRAANTGISAFIDPYGRIVSKMPLNKEGFLDVKLFEKLDKTIYDKYGAKILLLLLIFILLPTIINKSIHVFRTKSN